VEKDLMLSVEDFAATTGGKTVAARKKRAADRPRDELSRGGFRGRRTPTAAQRQEFARRLQTLADAKGWNQSDLARAAFGTVTDGQGYEVARRRDSISSYLRGSTFPDQRSFDALCSALGVAPKELAPFTDLAERDDEGPALEIRQIPGNPGKVWIRLQQIVSLADALAISAIIVRALAQTSGAAPAQQDSSA
jgi:transcriptional regulator with XRE-family HTH domain